MLTSTTSRQQQNRSHRIYSRRPASLLLLAVLSLLGSSLRTPPKPATVAPVADPAPALSAAAAAHDLRGVRQAPLPEPPPKRVKTRSIATMNRADGLVTK